MKEFKNENLYHIFHPSPVGKLLLIATTTKLRAILWQDEAKTRARDGDTILKNNHPVLKQTARELDEYFAGKRTTFTIPIDPVGTEFQLRAWKALCKIPYGETRSYGEQARMVGNANACRAVGGANGKNPIPIIVPCHRVIGSNGTLTGFGGGLPVKKKLLMVEGIL